MTTIVAIQTPDDVHFAWDSQTTSGNVISLQGESKVWCQNGIVFGVGGAARFADLIRVLDFPEYDGSDSHTWLIANLVPAIQEIISATGPHPWYDQEDGTASVALIIVVDGTAYEMDSIFSPGTTYDGVYAIGSGSAFALGAMYAGADVIEAVDIAAKLDAYTGGEVHYATATELILSEK